MVPIAGSAYTYSYAALGEILAWIIGWDLIIEYAIGNVAVAISWSGYFSDLLTYVGIHIPPWLATDYRTAVQMAADAAAGEALSPLAGALEAAPHLFGVPIIVNVPAFLHRGPAYGPPGQGRPRVVHASTRSSCILKLAIIVFFIAIGIVFFRAENLVSHGGFAPNGFLGISSAAAIIFFAYIGFDAVSTAAEETKNPAKDMPFGILMSLVICTVAYIAVGLVMTGMAPWDRLGTAEPMLTALELSGGSPTLVRVSQIIIAIGAVVAMTSVLLVFQFGQPRIFFAMARDGLLPKWAAKMHPKYRTPHVTTIITGVFVGGLAAFANINEMVELTNIGTLFAFVLVSVGVSGPPIYRPGPAPPLPGPWAPLVPILAAAGLHLPHVRTSVGHLGPVRGVADYGRFHLLFYGSRHSVLRQEAKVAAGKSGP